MKKIFGRNKGFTLVECIIAVAVFGLLSLVVFMILTNASVRAAKASESEGNLAQLIENVVGDETYKKYDATDPNTRVMTLTIDNINGSGGAGNLTVSYNVISGYKNFIECPSCSHRANFTDFMSSTMGDPANEPHMVAEPPTTFDVGTNYFVCPNCYDTFTFNVRCPDCAETNVYNQPSSSSASGYLFTYLQTESGGFECSVCGGTAVMAVDAAGNFVSEKVSKDGLNVSGMVPNGIRYGASIDWNNRAVAVADTCTFWTVSTADSDNLGNLADDAGGKVFATLKYQGTSNSSFAGKYYLQLSVNGRPGSIGSSDLYFIRVLFPTGYTLNFKNDATNPPYDSSNVVSIKKEKTTISGKDYPTLLIKCSAGSFSNLFKNQGLEFTLTSNESGYSFEYDYNREAGHSDSEQGLYRWFDFGSVTTTRTTGDYLSTASANYSIINN